MEVFGIQEEGGDDKAGVSAAAVEVAVPDVLLRLAVVVDQV